MMNTQDSPMSRAWSRIEAEQRSDRLFRRLTIAGWSATGLIVLLLVSFGILQLRAAMRFLDVGAASIGMVISGTIPIVLAVGAFCALAATLATIGLFLRMRAASLHEIQLRLAALEDLLTQTTPRTDA